MKKVHIAVLAVFVLILSASVAWAGGTAIFINGNQLVTDDPAVVEDGRTLLPMRATFEALGQTVDWNEETRTVTSGEIVLQIDNPVALVKGEEVVLDVPAKLINGRTFVPLRFVAESLGKEVNWDGEQNRIDINDVVEDEEEAVVEEGATDENLAEENEEDESEESEENEVEENEENETESDENGEDNETEE